MTDTTSRHIPDAAALLDADFGPWTDKPTTTTPGQQERDHVLWTSEDGVVTVGVWEAGVGSFTAVRDGFHESCHVISGEVNITDDTGEHRLGPGSVFVMPDGWSGRWDVIQPVRKSYVVITTRR